MEKSKQEIFRSSLKTTGVWFVVLTIIIFIFNSKMIGTQGSPDHPVYGGISIGLVLFSSMSIAGIVSLIVFLITYLIKSNNQKDTNNV